jgi:hypothetical protein
MYPENHWERRCHELEAFLSWIYSQNWCPPQVRQFWPVPFTQPQPPPILRSSNSSLYQQTPSPLHSFSNQAQISTTPGPPSLANDSGHNDSLTIRIYKPKATIRPLQPSQPSQPPEPPEPPLEPPEPLELRELNLFVDQITKAENWNVSCTSEVSVDLLLFGNPPET